eukprot:TRINITY_DN8668_c0_g1_i6.p1 TRINITY_DN8668_c0_g1~~TRINITY_DN8668_c0_g1_i6.p1  ORF type:complete len:674 (-),score=80.81 TRINITY_DN8668_c0_g1_i6:102-2123(-)
MEFEQRLTLSDTRGVIRLANRTSRRIDLVRFQSGPGANGAKFHSRELLEAVDCDQQTDLLTWAGDEILCAVDEDGHIVFALSPTLPADITIQEIPRFYSLSEDDCNIIFRNNHETTMEISWISEQQELMSCGLYGPHATFSQVTWPTHAWLFQAQQEPVFYMCAQTYSLDLNFAKIKTEKEVFPTMWELKMCSPDEKEKGTEYADVVSSTGPGGAGGAGPFDPNFSLRTLDLAPKTINALILFVDFPDAPAPESVDTRSICSQVCPLVRTWFQQASYGRISIHFYAIHHWYRLSGISSSYESTTYQGHETMLGESFRCMVQTTYLPLDLSKFELFYVAAMEGGTADASRAWHPVKGQGVHVPNLINPEFACYPLPVSQPDDSPLADTVVHLEWQPRQGDDDLEQRPLCEIRHAVTLDKYFFGNPASLTYSIVAHETGHLLGLPDLYELNSREGRLGQLWSVGGWDNMSWVCTAADFSAWQKWKLGWLTGHATPSVAEPPAPSQPTWRREVSYLLAPLGEVDNRVKAVMVFLRPDVYLGIEVRVPSGNDSRVFQGGVLVYEVFASCGTGQCPMRVLWPGLEWPQGPVSDVPLAEWIDMIQTYSRELDSELLEEHGPHFASAMMPGQSLSMRFARGSIRSEQDSCLLGLVVSVLELHQDQYRVSIEFEFGKCSEN